MSEYEVWAYEGGSMSEHAGGSMSEYEVWTYKVELYNELTHQSMTFYYDLDLGEDGDANGSISPDDLHNEVISGVEDFLRIIPTFKRSSTNG